MNIELYDGDWIINEYRISGDKDQGYDIFKEDDEYNCCYSTDDFESVLTWCWNS